MACSNSRAYLVSLDLPLKAFGIQGAWTTVIVTLENFVTNCTISADKFGALAVWVVARLNLSIQVLARCLGLKRVSLVTRAWCLIIMGNATSRPQSLVTKQQKREAALGDNLMANQCSNVFLAVWTTETA